jgi:hypothetical protein
VAIELLVVLVVDVAVLVLEYLVDVLVIVGLGEMQLLRRVPPGWHGTQGGLEGFSLGLNSDYPARPGRTLMRATAQS